MKHLISSIQSNPVLAYNEVGSSNAETIPIRAVFNSTQSHHVDSAECFSSMSWSEFDSAFSMALSAVYGCGFGDDRELETACSEVQDIMLVQMPAELGVDSPSEMDVDADAKLLAPHFAAVHAEIFKKWIEYNIECCSLLAQGDSAPPEIDVNLLLAMMNCGHAGEHGADELSVTNRAEQFARKHNINPLAWSVLVIFNGKPETFLPREEHCVIVSTAKKKSHNPITAYDVNLWRYNVKNQRVSWSQAAFAKSRKLNPTAFRHVFDKAGEQGPGRPTTRWSQRHTAKQIFIAPELLGLSDSRYERIVAQHIERWGSARQDNDYGLMCYLSQKYQRFDLKNDVVSWQCRQETSKQTGVALTVSDFAEERQIPVEIWQDISTDIENWNGMPALERLHFAMTRFALSHSLDMLAWYFFTWSNEWAILMQSESEVEKIQEIQLILHSLQEMLKERIRESHG
jgi:hypothetical protein